MQLEGVAPELLVAEHVEAKDLPPLLDHPECVVADGAIDARPPESL
jgi:hypothetical protein